MVAQRPGAELHAVEHQIVLGAAHAQRVGLQERQRLGRRQAERVVPVGEPAGLLVDLEEREIDHPEQRPAAGGRAAAEADEGEPQGAQHLRRRRSGSSAANTTRSPGSACMRSTSARCSASARNLTIGPRSARPSSTYTYAMPLAPCSLASSVRASIWAREKAAAPGARSARTTPPDLDRAAEHLEAALGEDLRPLDDLQPEARVRLVGAVARHRLVEREDGQRQLRRVLPHPGEDGRHQTPRAARGSRQRP